MREPHQTPTVGSREKSVRPSTTPEPAPTRAVPKDLSSREVRSRTTGTADERESLTTYSAGRATVRSADERER
jgi:hypothetical protein